MNSMFMKNERDEFMKKYEVTYNYYQCLLELDIKIFEQLSKYKKDVLGEPLTEKQVEVSNKFLPYWKRELEYLKADKSRILEKELNGDYEQKDESKLKNISQESFQEFKKSLSAIGKKGVLKAYTVQTTGHKVLTALLETGVDSKGEKLTDEELEAMRLVLKEVENNLTALREEYKTF